MRTVLRSLTKPQLEFYLEENLVREPVMIRDSNTKNTAKRNLGKETEGSGEPR